MLAIAFVDSIDQKLLEVVKKLDPPIQARFANIMLPERGESRLPRSGPHLMFVVDRYGGIATNSDKLIGNSAWKGVLYVLGNKTKPFDAKTMTGRFSGDMFFDPHAQHYDGLRDVKSADLINAARKARPDQVSNFAQYKLITRRVLATDKQCTSCHRGTKLNGQIGLLAYVFKKSN